MAQQPSNDFNIDPALTSGNELAEILNRLNNVLLTMRSGPSRPVSALAGTSWLDTSEVPTVNIHRLMFFDGTNDLEIALVNVSTHEITLPYADNNFLPLDGSRDMTGDLIIGLAADINTDRMVSVRSSYGGVTLRLSDEYGDGAIIQTASNGALEDLWVQMLRDGGVNLYYNSSKKIETTNTGVTVTGELVADSLNVAGTITAVATSPRIIAKTSSASGYASHTLQDSNGVMRAELKYDDSIGYAKLQTYDDVGSAETGFVFSSNQVRYDATFSCASLAADNGATQRNSGRWYSNIWNITYYLKD